MKYVENFEQQCFHEGEWCFQGIDVTASSEVSQNSELLLDALPNLLPGLPPEKFYDLNITLDDDVAKLGMVEGLSRQQVAKSATYTF